ncbi:MAG: response regulator [Muribaculum sp.]|nr:response regulator [Muribaculaceae bacterium]MCM1081635.1 response regulator [Muribaculum sp.]
MANCLTKILCAAVAAIAAAGPAQGAITLGVSEGLSNGFVNSIAEDARGNVWVATEDGLNRWDGKQFHVFRPSNSGLSASELNCVVRLPDDDGHIWVGSQRDGVCCVDIESGEITSLTEPEFCSKDITAITPGRSGGMWLCHYYFGPQFYNPATDELMRPVYEQLNAIPVKSWTAVEGNDGKIYVGHVDAGFSVVDTVSKVSHTYTYPDLPGNQVFAVYIDNNDNVWLGTNDGAAVFNPHTQKITKFENDPANPLSIQRGAVRAIYQIRNGEMLFATSQGGLSLLDLKSYAYTDIADAKFRSLPINGSAVSTSCPYVKAIMQDSYGNIWLGNYRNGVDFISRLPELFTRVNLIGNMGYNPVWCSTQGENGSRWIGAENEIVRIGYFAMVKQHVLLPDVHSDNTTYVRSMAMDPATGNIWVGTQERGLFVYNPKSNSWTTVHGVPHTIRVVTMQGDSVLVGTDYGVMSIDKVTRNAHYVNRINSQLIDLVINSITVDNDHRIWVGTLGKGLHVFDRRLNLVENHLVDNGFPSNAINSVMLAADSTMWVGTRNGLVCFAPGNTSLYNKIESVDSLGVSHVMSVATDNDRNIWLSTNKGIVRYNPKTQISSLYIGSKTTPLHSFVEGSAMRDEHGDIFFASMNGMVKVDPQRASAPVDPAPVTVTDFIALKRDNQGLDNSRNVAIHKSRVVVPHNENTFTIIFSIPDYAQMEHAEFIYRLSGLNDLWTMTHGENKATFREVPPGTYKFLVSTRQNGGVWDEPKHILTIVVEHPLWATWWAKLIYAILIVAMAAMFVALFRHRYKMKRRLEIERERSRNSQALNEERIRFYTNVTHELRTPLTLILGPLEDIVSDPELPGKFSYKMQMIRNSSTSLLNLINGILEFRKTETHNRRMLVRKANLANLVREIGLRFKELNQNPDVDIVIDIEADSPEMYFDAEMITVIINNLMSNAVKYTGSGEIRLGFHTSTSPQGIRTSRISVSDTGYGISPKALEHIFERYYQENGRHQASGTGIGLALVKSLADLHNAELTVKSEENKGTEFTLTLLTDEIYPNALRSEQQAAPSPASAAEETNEDDGNSPRKVLVVEDNADIREYIRQILSDEAEVHTAVNGLEGLKMAQELQPDIIISDIMMPEMDGITMCRTLKEDVITSHIPIILLTAKDSMADKEEGYMSGADSYLTKPFSAKLLKIRIHNLMMARRQFSKRMLATDGSTTAEPPTQDEAAERQMITPLDRQFLDKLQEIINLNIENEDLSVVFLADKMCMSNSTLYRKITSLLGLSPNDYIRRLRLTKAVELLRSRQWSITEIAYKTGFGSHSSFGKVFKKEYGVTPTEFLNSK